MPLVSSGGSQTVLVDTTEVSSAQILDLNNTPVEITATPAADKIIFPLSTLYRLNWGTTVYTSTDAGAYIYVSTIAEQQSNNQGYWFVGFQSLNFMVIPWGFSTMTLAARSTDDVSVAGALGQALAIFTGGAGQFFEDGDSSLTIATSYVLMDGP